MPDGLKFSVPAQQQQDDGLDWNGYIQPPSIPPDPIGDDWRGPPGPQGPPGQNADFQDAPSDGTLYGRLSATWARGLPLTGGTLSGNLQLPNGTLAAPSLAFGAVDGTGLNRSANVISIGVQGTLAGSFFANAVQFNQTMFMLNNRIQQVADPTAAADALNLRTGDARYTLASGGPFVPISGGTMTGPLMVPAGTANAPGLLLGTNSCGFYGSGATTAVTSIGTQIMQWSLSGITAYASLNMNNNRITTVANATAATDALNQQTGDARYMAAAAGPYAPLASPALTGTPTVPTAAPGTNTGQAASTAFVSSAIAGATAGVASFNGRTGIVTLAAADVTGVGGALLASPVFTGDARAVTATAGDNDTSIATTAFVQAAARTINRANNTGFSVNQRPYVSGTALAAGAFGHDRWKTGGGGGTYTFAQSPGPSTVVTITAGTLQQVVEGAALIAGNYMLSWTGTAQGRVGAGSYAASPVSVAGITAGANTTIEFNAGTLSQVKFEAGTTATAWAPILPTAELADCQRFYQIGSFTVGFPSYAVGATSRIVYTFATTMRAVPTVVLSPGSLTNASAAILATAGQSSMYLQAGSTAVGTFAEAQGNFTASADL